MKIVSQLIKLLDAPEELKDRLREQLFHFMLDMAGKQPSDDLKRSFKYAYELD